MSANESNAMRFLLAGVANTTAAFVTNPIEVIKTRLQLEGELASQSGLDGLRNRYYKGFIRGSITIVRDEGIGGLYKGLMPSMMRSGTYSTFRLGAYEPLKRLMGETDTSTTPLWKKICCAATSGAIGSSIATPTDVVKVRMQAEGPLLAGQKRRYTSTLGAFVEIFRTEGIRGLYRGMVPTVQRAAIFTASQVSTYDHCKHTILNYQLMNEGLPLHFVASFTAGFVSAVMTNPVDVIKTRVMNQKSKVDGSAGGIIYRNSLDCLVKTLKSEGVVGLYKGFIPNWMRLGPNTVITFLIFEHLRRWVDMRPI